MGDNKTKPAPQDSARVNINEHCDVEYWSKRFDCSRDELMPKLCPATITSPRSKRFTNPGSICSNACCAMNAVSLPGMYFAEQ